MPDAQPEQSELDELLATLVAGEVEFILIGGAAALIHGAPITTQDIDIVHRRTPPNVARLLAVLDQLDATTPTAAGLESQGQTLLSTRVGRLDTLGALHDGRGYEELIGHTDIVDLDGAELRVIDLETLIEIKPQPAAQKIA